ncbi:MAG: hypothetical protein E7510_08420 [Ruminococcus sp.]|nr:hypothetical protein [Ruminococcus sp.]
MNVNSTDNSYTSASYSNKGISGMASGMDTEGLVQALLSDVQKKIDKQEQEKQIYEWKQEEYREVIDKINDFREKYLSTTGDKSIMLSSTFKTSNTESSSSAIKATSTTNSVNGSFTVNVSKLASAAKITSSENASKNMSVAIKNSSEFMTGSMSRAKFINIGFGEGKNIEVDISGATSNEDIVDRINSGIARYNKVEGASVTISASVKDGKIVYSGSGENVDFSVDGSNSNIEKTGVVTTGAFEKENSITLKLGDKELKIDLAGETDIKSAINNAIGGSELDGEVTLSDSEGVLSFNVSGDEKLSISGTKAGLASVGLEESATSVDGKIEAQKEMSVATNKFTVGDKEIALADDDTLETIAEKINTAMGEDSGVVASVSSGTLKIVSTKGKDITINGTEADLAKLGLKEETKATETSVMEVEAPEINSKGTLNITYNGVAKGINITDTDTLDSLKDKLYNAFGSGLKLDDNGNFTAGTGKSISVSGSDEILNYFGIEKNATSNFIDTSKKVSELYGMSDDDDIKFTINNVDFSFKGSTSLADIMAEVNDSRAGVTLTFNSLNDKFTIKSDETGKDTSLNLKDVSGGLITKMFGSNELSAVGDDALLEIDGEEVSYSSNDITYNGVNLTLREPTNGEVTIDTSVDTDKALDAIVSFVEDYNALIEDLNKRIHAEAEYKEYAPLTDAQEDEMTDKEIEKWTEKSKTGLLSKDSDISKFLQEMRAVLYSKVEGVPMLSDIGIESSKEWKDYGKLTIDKDKLTETLENDMQSVASVFTGKNGVASRLEGACKRAANTSSGSPGSLVTLAGVKGKATEKENTITDRIDTIKEKIEKLKEQYETKKERYWKQFNAMETALSSMNSTATWLSSMLMGGM